MIPKDCKRLAEVDFPIAEVSRHSAREKSIRHGHPSTLHLWWARRPLAACRAMLLALLLPDPCDPHCPEAFKKKARAALAGLPLKIEPDDDGLRRNILRFIADFANWDLSSNATYVHAGRALVKAAHPEETQLVVDPFAGGGSIPLEALRLGCETFASDVNPVACLILKVMLEDIPRHGPELAEELRRVGTEIKKQAEKELADFYPKDPDGATPIAYLWARTVRCESPNCGAEIPLMRSFWLCKKASRRRALKYKVVRPKDGASRVEFEVFKPNADKEVSGGTVRRAKAMCPCCNMVLPPERVRAQLSEQRGGADGIFDAKGNRTGGARMLAVVTLHPGVQGRNYRLSTQRDYQAVWKARKRLKAILDQWEHGGKKGLCPVPDEPMDLKDSTTLAGRGYGATEWGNLFTSRQALALTSLGGSLRKTIANDKNGVPSELLALVVSRCSDFNSSLTSWANGGEFVRSTFGRQALPMVWDFCETFPFSSESGGFDGALDWVYRVLNHLTTSGIDRGQVEEADACESPLPDETAAVWFTDPPYYDAISYALLSDFFFVWLKRTLSGHPLLRDRFDIDNPLTPKLRECIQTGPNETAGRVKDQAFFEDTMSRAFAEGCRILQSQGIGCVVFAHKTTEGWEALLSGVIAGKWVIVGSWPIVTERGSRQIARDAAALQTSIHLVCRPRPEDAPVGDWADVLRELPSRVGGWMERLQGEGIRGADLVFACIGPALEIFSRYSKVETPEGRTVELAEYLEKVWEVVGRSALQQILGTAEARARNGAAAALEEDARLTALFLWTLQSSNASAELGAGGDTFSSKGDSAGAQQQEEQEDEAPRKKPRGFNLIFDVARRFAQPLGIVLNDWEDRIIETKKGVVRLLSVSERAEQLFGKKGASAIAEEIESHSEEDLQLSLFSQDEEGAAPQIRGRVKRKRSRTLDKDIQARREATTLDRVHAAMLLQASGKTNALRALLREEKNRGTDFLRLANALSALYPRGCEEKRLIDAMLLAVPR